MDIFIHLIIFSAAIAALWFFAGLIVESVDSVAKRFNNSGFVVAFFLLGFLTSIGEMSVAINSVISGVPQVAAGNLVGASFVLLLFVIPLLAVVGKGIRMNKLFDGWRLAYVLAIVALPSFFLVDGSLSGRESIATLLFLVSLIWVIKSHGVPPRTSSRIVAENKRSPLLDIGKVIISAVVIFLAGHLLVGEAVYFADMFNAPQSLMGMILLSVGTNIPEIAIAVRSVVSKRSEVALGNYLGSATMNTALFAFLGIASAPFVVDRIEFVASFLFTAVGFALFYYFIRSKDILSRKEGFILLGVYALFLGTHITALVRDCCSV